MVTPILITSSSLAIEAQNQKQFNFDKLKMSTRIKMSNKVNEIEKKDEIKIEFEVKIEFKVTVIYFTIENKDKYSR